MLIKLFMFLMKSLYRFLVPKELTVREFADVIHKRINPGPEKEISLYVGHDRLLESNLVFILLALTISMIHARRFSI